MAGEAPLKAPDKIQVKSFRCEKCGGPLVSRGMRQTASIVCGNCGSIIDATDENLRILGQFNQRQKETPRIPLGAKGELRGEKWQVIGFVRRFIMVDGERYRWSEYLLFNPYIGFRWLTEYEGHWNYVRQCVDRPHVDSSAAVRYRGTPYKHFQSAQATVEYVIGEFYWRVQAEDTCAVTDYVAPPLMLSCEKSGNEVTWSSGEYIEPDEIQKAFKLTSGLPSPSGIYANQPSPYVGASKYLGKAAAVFIAALILVQVLMVAGSQNKQAYSNRFMFDPAAAEKSLVSDVFTLEGRPSNVVIRSYADVNNAWIFLSMALINDDTGVAYDFGREISYYSGQDEDGTWTEGNREDSVTIAHVPAGRYYLRVEPEGAVTPVSYSLAVYRDTPSWLLFLVALIALTIVPVVAWILETRFEYRRWAESDHPWTTTSDS